MIIKTVLVSLGAATLGIVQSAFLSKIMPLGIVPDIALILLITASWRYGAYTGSISGFLLGISFDMMSLSPLGFFALVYTLIGYFFGRFFASVPAKSLLISLLALLLGTALKYLLSYTLGLFLGMHSTASQYFRLESLAETGLNIIFAPLVIFLFNIIAPLIEGKRRGFH